MPDESSPPLQLSAILDALSDETRRRVLLGLARADACCSSFGDLGSKTRMTYHFAQLRKAGLIGVTKAGTHRIMSLRREEVQAAFPGLLDAVLEAAMSENREYMANKFFLNESNPGI